MELLLFVGLVAYFLQRLDGYDSARLDGRVARRRYIRVTYGVVAVVVALMFLLPAVVR